MERTGLPEFGDRVQFQNVFFPFETHAGYFPERRANENVGPPPFVVRSEVPFFFLDDFNSIFLFFSFRFRTVSVGARII